MLMVSRSAERVINIQPRQAHYCKCSRFFFFFFFLTLLVHPRRVRVFGNAHEDANFRTRHKQRQGRKTSSSASSLQGSVGIRVVLEVHADLLAQILPELFHVRFRLLEYKLNFVRTFSGVCVILN